jgi:hypothetical protein
MIGEIPFSSPGSVSFFAARRYPGSLARRRRPNQERKKQNVPL